MAQGDLAMAENGLNARAAKVAQEIGDQYRDSLLRTTRVQPEDIVAPPPTRSGVALGSP